MKYLISSDLVVLRKGEFVEVSSGSGEFIFDDSNRDELTRATLFGMAVANKIPAKTRHKHSEIFDLIINSFPTFKIPEQNKMTESAMIKKIVTEGFEADKEDNEILVALVNNGVSFKDAVKQFNVAMQELGFRISPKERYEQAEKILSEAEFSPENYQEVHDAVIAITEKISNTSEKQAMISVRKYCRLNDVDMPKAEKVVGGARALVFGWMVKNPSATFEAFVEYCESINKPKMAKSFWPLFEVASKMAVQINELSE